MFHFFFFGLNLDFIGGGGDLSTIPKTLFALFVILYIQKCPTFLRFFGYLGIILFLATISIHEKREAFFLLFPIMFFESIRHSLRLNFKTTLFLSILMTYSFNTNISYVYCKRLWRFREFTSIFSTISLIPSYLNSDIFIGGLLLNIEVGYFYFHGINAIELVLNDLNLMSLGSTIIKPLFLFIPRFIFPNKPEQIITLYAQEFDPAFRAMGGSYPISIFSEFFWNFHLVGIFMTIFLIIFCYYVYANLINAVKIFHVPKILFFMVCYLNIIMLARGSGLDLYILFVLLSGFFIMCYSFLEAALFKD